MIREGGSWNNDKLKSFVIKIPFEGVLNLGDVMISW